MHSIKATASNWIKCADNNREYHLYFIYFKVFVVKKNKILVLGGIVTVRDCIKRQIICSLFPRELTWLFNMGKVTNKVIFWMHTFYACAYAMKPSQNVHFSCKIQSSISFVRRPKKCMSLISSYNLSKEDYFRISLTEGHTESVMVLLEPCPA